MRRVASIYTRLQIQSPQDISSPSSSASRWPAGAIAACAVLVSSPGARDDASCSWTSTSTPGQCAAATVATSAIEIAAAAGAGLALQVVSTTGCPRDAVDNFFLRVLCRALWRSSFWRQVRLLDSNSESRWKRAHCKSGWGQAQYWKSGKARRLSRRPWEDGRNQVHVCHALLRTLWQKRCGTPSSNTALQRMCLAHILYFCDAGLTVRNSSTGKGLMPLAHDRKWRQSSYASRSMQRCSCVFS